MLKQATRRAYACLETKLVDGTVASISIFRVFGATPVPSELL
jgi:hypothetical protein